MSMYDEIQNINSKPEVFGYYTAKELWDDEFTSQKMLEYHLNKSVDVSSRNYNFIASSLEWIIQKFELGQGKAVCDFGCAVGHYTSGFASAGAAVTGLDFSRRTLEYAKSKAAEESLCIDYRCMDYLSFSESGKYDLVTMIMCDFCVLSPEQRKTLLRVFFDALKSGGHVLLDAYTLAAFMQVEEKAVYEKNQLSGFWSEDDYYAFVNTFKYDEEKVSLDKYTVFEPNRSKVIYNWLQYFSVESITREFEGSGFDIEAVYANVAGGDYSEEKYEFAIVAQKK